MLTDLRQLFCQRCKVLQDIVQFNIHISLHYIRKLFIVARLSKSNFKDHYGDIVITQ